MEKWHFCEITNSNVDVASPLVLSSSSQGWASSTGLENWMFPRWRRPDNTWNTIQHWVFWTRAPLQGSVLLATQTGQVNTFLHKNSKHISSFMLIPNAPITEGKLKFTGIGSNIWLHNLLCNCRPSGQEYWTTQALHVDTDLLPTLKRHSKRH